MLIETPGVASIFFSQRTGNVETVTEIHFHGTGTLPEPSTISLTLIAAAVAVIFALRRRANLHRRYRDQRSL